jgi:hypothetical protein
MNFIMLIVFILNLNFFGVLYLNKTEMGGFLPNPNGLINSKF